MEDKLVSLYVDCPQWDHPIQVDDFIVAIGKKQTNSVYHVAETKTKNFPEKRMTRNYLKVYRSDLITALRRDQNQRLLPMQWYNRNKKQKL